MHHRQVFYTASCYGALLYRGRQRDALQSVCLSVYPMRDSLHEDRKDVVTSHFVEMFPVARVTGSVNDPHTPQ